jgi:hypothetical protein
MICGRKYATKLILLQIEFGEQKLVFNVSFKKILVLAVIFKYNFDTHQLQIFYDE